MRYINGRGAPKKCRNVTVLLRHHPVLSVESGDIITVAGGIIIVLVIAVVANPHYLADLHDSLSGGTPARTATTPPETTGTVPLPAFAVSPAATVIPITATAPFPPLTPSPPLRILYTDKPFSYPVVRLPDRLELLGESDIRRSGQDVVTFAYIEDGWGGLTRTFSVPYPVWTMDIRVIDNVTPNTGSFRMALCYAANGSIIEGVEIEHPGSAYKKIQSSDIPLYLIITTTSIEKYRIELQTSRQYYEQFGPMKATT